MKQRVKEKKKLKENTGSWIEKDIHKRNIEKMGSYPVIYQKIYHDIKPIQSCFFFFLPFPLYFFPNRNNLFPLSGRFLGQGRALPITSHVPLPGAPQVTLESASGTQLRWIAKSKYANRAWIITYIIMQTFFLHYCLCPASCPTALSASALSIAVELKHPGMAPEAGREFNLQDGFSRHFLSHSPQDSCYSSGFHCCNLDVSTSERRGDKCLVQPLQSTLVLF